MPRAEFPRKIKAQLALRAGGNCELCGAKLKVGEGEADHIVPCELGGEATIDNGQWICRVCHREKTHGDVRAIRKSDRIRDKATGAMKKPSRFPNSRDGKWKTRLDGTTVRRSP